MPIRKVKGGWKWAGHGHVAQADKHEAETNKTLDKLYKIRFGG